MKVKRAFSFTIILTLFFLNVFSQNSSPKDYNNFEILSPQKKLAIQFRHLLERNQPDSAMQLLDTKYLSNNPNIKREIIQAGIEISKIYKQCMPRGEIITYIKDYNIVNTYYTIPPTPKFSISLYFQQGNINSKIQKVEIKDELELKKQQEKIDNDIPPKQVPSKN